MAHHIRTVAVLVTCMLALGACSDDDVSQDPSDDLYDQLDAEERRYADALVAALDDDVPGATDPDTSACAAAAVVRTVGTDGFTAAGLSPEDIDVSFDLSEIGLSPADVHDAETLADGFTRCGIAQPTVAAMSFSQVLDRSSLDERSAEALVRCVEAELDDETAEAILVEVISQEPRGGPGVQSSDLADLVRSCGHDTYVYP